LSYSPVHVKCNKRAT